MTSPTSKSTTEREAAQKLAQISQDLWQFVPLAKFGAARPQEPTQEAVRHGLRTIWSRLAFRRGTPSESDPVAEAGDLTSAPRAMVERAVPQPDLAGMGGPVLDAALESWLTQENAPAQTFVSAPGSGVDEMVRAWGQDHGLDFLPPPPPEAVLAGGAWLDQVAADGETTHRRYVIIGLERWFLRHPDGLDLVRRLLDLIWHGHITCLLTCDSWAWAYLNRVLHVETILPGALTLAPFGEKELGIWFRLLADLYEPRNLIFRQVNNGRPILTPASDVPETSPTGEASNADREFLTHLAARSRGNLGVARAIWRECLLVKEQEEVEAKAQEEAAGDRGYTMWVTPWPKVNLPVLPPGAGRAEAFVLHALLLHNGLSSTVLPDLLPLERGEVVRIVQSLRTARLVAADAERWAVTLAGYPAVRTFLSGEGFLTDGL